MTLREEIQSKIDAIKTKAAADVAELETHLAAGGSWLEQETTAFEEWAKNLVAKVRAAL